MKIKALVVDDHQMFRTLFVGALRTMDIEVVAEASSGEAAIHLAGQYQPDLIFMDLRLPPGMSGLRAAKTIKAKYPQIKILACTGVDESFVFGEIIKAGLDGLLLKGGAADKIGAAVAAVMRNEMYFDEETMAHVKDLPDLSQLELDILLLLAEGRVRAAIASQLKLSLADVDEACEQLHQKFSAHTDAHLVAAALLFL